MQMTLYDPKGYKLLKRLRLDFSHLHKYNFQHNFADALKPLCSCALETESTCQFFLCCQNYVLFCRALINELTSIDCGIVSLRPNALVEVTLYGDQMLNIKSPNTYCDYQLHQKFATV